MKGVYVTALLLCMSLAANAQTAVQQSGPVSTGHVVMWSTDHVVRSAAGSSGDVAGKMLTDGLSTVGQVCSFSNTTDQGGISLCLDGANGRLLYNGTAYPISGGGGNVVGPVSSAVGNVVFFNNTTGSLLQDMNWLVNSFGMQAPTNYSFVTQGLGTFQVGGTNGPFMFNDTALDTISFQAKVGALPSGDTTNIQVYPPVPGGKAFINLTKLASLSPAGEERLIIGTDGSTYIFQQVLSGTGICHNVSFLDGESPNPAFILACGGGGITPSFMLGDGGSITGYASHIAGNLMMRIDATANLILGEGANIGEVLASKPLDAGSSFILSAATPSVGVGKAGLGTSTAAAASCGALAGSTGCWKINFGGTDKYIPYY